MVEAVFMIKFDARGAIQHMKKKKKTGKKDIPLTKETEQMCSGRKAGLDVGRVQFE